MLKIRETKDFKIILEVKQLHILIVDDESELRELLSRILQFEGYDTQTGHDGISALKKIEKLQPHVVITDVQMPGMRGTDLVTEIKKLSPNTEVICLTAYGNIQDGVQAIKNGAYDYLEKDSYRTKILPLVAKAAEKASISFGSQKPPIHKNNKGSFEAIIGNSTSLKRAIDVARKVAKTDASLLITGPTGSGKEVFAVAIHNNSLRASEKLVTINCAALSREILESELFGHKAGAFTGAIKDKKGLFEEAHKGTLFLDEIGELELDLQAKILRVLENGTFIKLGDTKEQKVDVRILSATNRDLPNAIEGGKFREDLYYRLAMFQIELPGLNERKEDILPLANFFLTLSTEKMNKQISGFSPDFITALEKHNWKGNIRELRNLIERSVILTDSAIVTIDTLPVDFQTQNEIVGKGIHSLREIEKSHIKKILDYTNGNKTKTAKILDIGLTTLYAKIKEYDIQ